jgi:hypothetical protein
MPNIKKVKLKKKQVKNIIVGKFTKYRVLFIDELKGYLTKKTISSNHKPVQLGVSTVILSKQFFTV